MKKLIGFLALAILAAAPAFAQAPPPASEVASYNATAQAANIASTPVSPQINPVIYNLGGTYEVDCYVITTQAATTSSTMPACNVIFTDADTGNSHTVALTATSTANAVDTIGAATTNLPAGGVIHAKPGTAISLSTTSYASSGATALNYAIHFTLSYVGP